MISGHIAHSTYTKYLSLILTPDVLADFMCANEAKLILEQLNFMKKRSVLSKNVWNLKAQIKEYNCVYNILLINIRHNAQLPKNQDYVVFKLY